MQEQWPDQLGAGRILRLAVLFGLSTGAVWAVAFGWRGWVLGLVGATSVVGIFLLARYFSLRMALLVATLTVFLLLMFGASNTSGEWPGTGP